MNGQFGGAGDQLGRASTTANDCKKKFLTPEEAANYLGGLNSRTVTRWAREGYLPSYPIGEGKRRIWRFLTNDLEQWMRLRRTGTLLPAADVPTGGL